MQLRTFLQIPEYNGVRDEYWKYKTKIALPSQYSMSFSGIHDEVVYIMVSINIHVGKDMDSRHYACYLFYYNTGTCCKFDDEIITNYSGYPEKWAKKGKDNIVNGSDRIVSMLYIEETFSHPAPTNFVLRNQYPNILKILRR